MKMPETIYVGLEGIDAPPFCDADHTDKGFSFTSILDNPEDAARDGRATFVAEYRLVRCLTVTTTTPAPIIEVKEVPHG